MMMIVVVMVAMVIMMVAMVMMVMMGVVIKMMFGFFSIVLHPSRNISLDQIIVINV